MPDDKRRCAAIKGYLERNIMEFVNCKRIIFEKMNLSYSTFINMLMWCLVRKTAIYYAEYLDKKMDRKSLEKFIKREIHIILCTQREIYEEPDLDMSNNAKKHTEYLFNYMRSVFLPFESIEELSGILDAAIQLAESKEKELGIIFLNETYYNELLVTTYKTPQELKRKFELVLGAFSIKSIIERLTAQNADSIENLETIDKLLDEYRDEISKSPEKQRGLQKIQIILDEYITNRIKKIFEKTC